MKRTAVVTAAVVMVMMVIVAVLAVKAVKSKDNQLTISPESTTGESAQTTDSETFTIGSPEFITEESETETETETTDEKSFFDIFKDKEETTEKASTTKSVTSAAATSVSQAVSSITTTTKKEVSQTTTTTSSSDYEYAYAGFNPQRANMDVADWTLILVNRDYILPDGYVPELAYSVEGDTNSKKLDKRVAPHYNEMYQAAKKDGIILETVSGYRSYSLQKTNFENKINKYMNQGMSRIKATQEAATIILPPGTSEHNAGLAMDICSLEQSFENTKEFRWLMEHAEDYGFILRYPKDKQDITEIIYEPWHWRYVGVEHAREINAKGITLEEYLGVK